MNKQCGVALMAAIWAGGMMTGHAEEETPRGMPEIHAQLVPSQYTTLSSELAARIDRITVREGERFQQGDALVVFDCAFQRTQLEEAEATLVAAEKTRSVNRRLVELRAGGVLEADVAAAEAVKAQAKVKSAKVVLSKCDIRAPFSGRVVEQKAREHQYTQAGQPLLELLDDETLEVEFIAPSRWLVWMKTGLAFQVRVEETGQSYPARISRLGAKVDAVSHSVKVSGTIDGRYSELLAGMSGRVIIVPPESK